LKKKKDIDIFAEEIKALENKYNQIDPSLYSEGQLDDMKVSKLELEREKTEKSREKEYLYMIANEKELKVSEELLKLKNEEYEDAMNRMQVAEEEDKDDILKIDTPSLTQFCSMLKQLETLEYQLDDLLASTSSILLGLICEFSYSKEKYRLKSFINFHNRTPLLKAYADYYGTGVLEADLKYMEKY